MSNYVRVEVENADELLLSGMYGANAVIRVHSSADGVTFGNLGTIALVSGTRIYAISDTTGASTTWYRSRYENAGGSNTSDWSDAWQAGGEDGGLICSLYDVKQRLGVADTDDDEELLEYIRAVTVDIETVTGRDFTGTRSDVTVRFDTQAGYTLYMPQGITSVTTLKVAMTDQPDTGGTYETLAAADFVLRPSSASRSPGWPATSVRRIDGGIFYDAVNGVELTGRTGWAAVPSNVARIGANAVVRAWRARSSGGADYAIAGPDGGMRMLRYLSPEDRDLLDLYTDHASVVA